METGDKVVSISKVGKRKGQQGILVSKIEGTQKWVVRWADGTEKPYSTNKLQKMSEDSDHTGGAGPESSSAIVGPENTAIPRVTDDVEGTTGLDTETPDDYVDGTANTGVNGNAYETEEIDDDDMSVDIGAAISAFIAENTTGPAEYEGDAMYDGVYASETGEEVTALPYGDETAGEPFTYDDEMQDEFDDGMGMDGVVYDDGTGEGVEDFALVDESDEHALTYDEDGFVDDAGSRDEDYIGDPGDLVDNDLFVDENNEEHIYGGEVSNELADEISDGYNDDVGGDIDGSFDPGTDEKRDVEAHDEFLGETDDDINTDGIRETGDDDVMDRKLSEDQKVGDGVNAGEAAPLAPLVVTEGSGAERVDAGGDIASDNLAKKVGASDGPIAPSLKASDAMHEGDEVVSISKTGKRKGQQGTLVGKQIEGTEKWMVRWSDGVEKPYLIQKLKKKMDKPKDAATAETASPASLVEDSGVAENVDAEAKAQRSMERKANTAMGHEDVNVLQLDDEGAVSDGFTDDEGDVQEEDTPRGPLNPISKFSAALIADNEAENEKDELSDGFEDSEGADEDVGQAEAPRENRVPRIDTMNTITAMLVDDEGAMSDGFGTADEDDKDEELLTATLVTC